MGRTKPQLAAKTGDLKLCCVANDSQPMVQKPKGTTSRRSQYPLIRCHNLLETSVSITLSCSKSLIYIYAFIGIHKCN